MKFRKCQTQLICRFSNLSWTHLKGSRRIKIKNKRKKRQKFQWKYNNLRKKILFKKNYFQFSISSTYQACKSHDHDHQWTDMPLSDCLKTKGNVNIKLRDLCETDCLHFAPDILISPHGIDCKQSWCKKIYRMDSQLIETFDTGRSEKQQINWVWPNRRFICPLDFVHNCCFIYKMIRPFHIPSLINTHAWNHVNKQGYQVSKGNNIAWFFYF